jgi:hypothetical protein
VATTKSAKTTADTIAKMQALADHPNTPEHEAAAAKRYLTRLLARTAADAASKQGGIHQYSREDRLHFIGEKYDSKLTMTEIAKRIREEIKLARKYGAADTAPGTLATIDPIGAAPAGIKFSVRQPHYGSIVITLKNLPADWAWTRGVNRQGAPAPVDTEALKALKAELRLVLSAYNYDGSDIYTDHFDVNFYGSVDVDYPEVPASDR